MSLKTSKTLHNAYFLVFFHSVSHEHFTYCVSGTVLDTSVNTRRGSAATFRCPEEEALCLGPRPFLAALLHTQLGEQRETG